MDTNLNLKPRKKIVPTLVTAGPTTTVAAQAFEQAAQKKNPLENAADLIALRYGVLGDAPKINEEAFVKNRAVGKKVVPLKEYFEQTAKEFAQIEAEKKESIMKRKRENAKLTPCQRKFNTLQRNIEGYIEICNPAISNEAIIEMVDNARAKLAAKTIKKKPNPNPNPNPNPRPRARATKAVLKNTVSKNGGRRKWMLAKTTLRKNRKQR